jgi:hypothetical protein
MDHEFAIHDPQNRIMKVSLTVVRRTASEVDL